MSKQRFITLGSYTSPKVTEDKTRDWVGYGEDNNYFQYLIDRYNGSPTNNAVINSSIELLYGKGLTAENAAQKPDEFAQMKALFSDECIRRVCADYEMMGNYAIQVIYSKDRSKIVQVEHMPIELLRAQKCNIDGEVEAYYFANDWQKVAERSETPEFIPAFGQSNEGIEILYMKPYRAGFYYYSPVDYQGGLPYCEVEEEIANFHINNIQNAFAASMLINFNNGVPSEEDQSLLEARIKEKWTGTSNAGKIVVSFNDNKDLAASVEAIPIPDAHNQYTFISDECTQKIMVSHRVTSPMLLGIKDKTGLGNNANELVTAANLFMNMVISPKQRLIIDGLNKILAYNEISLKLGFRDLIVMEDEQGRISMSEQKKGCGCKETRLSEDNPCWEGYEMIGTKIKDGKEVPNCVPIDLEEDNPCWEGYEMVGTKIKDGREVPNCVPKNNLSSELQTKLAGSLLEKGEKLSENEWELIDERAVDYDLEEQYDLMFKFATAIQSDPNAVSEEQDTSIIKVRYKYTSGDLAKGSSRDFCKLMMSADKVYRKEDIDEAGAVNPGFGPNGASTYDIWLYKGGPWCQHFWIRQTYLRRNNKRISVNDAVRLITELDPSLRSEARMPVNDRKVAQPPRDMDDQGYLKPI